MYKLEIQTRLKKLYFQVILVYQNLYQFLKPEKSSGFQPVSNPKPENLKLVDPSAMPDRNQ